MNSAVEFRVDPHVKILDEGVVERAKERGLDALVYAPHFMRLGEIRERAARFSDDELRVFPGREVFAGTWRNRRHVLAVGLSDPVPDFITLGAAMTEFDRQNAAVLVPHPEYLTVSLDEGQIREYADVIDAVEVYNPKHWPGHNRRAQAVARVVDKPGFGSSYAHLSGTIGEAWTAFEEPFETVEEFAAALRAEVPRRVVHRNGRRHRLRCALEFCHLGWENTYGKVDRVLLSGTEPTHPRHIAYDGRFDAAAVY